MQHLDEAAQYLISLLSQPITPGLPRLTRLFGVATGVRKEEGEGYSSMMLHIDYPADIPSIPAAILQLRDDIIADYSAKPIKGVEADIQYVKRGCFMILTMWI